MMVKTSDFLLIVNQLDSNRPLRLPRSARRFNYSWQGIDHLARTDVPARKLQVCGWRDFWQRDGRGFVNVNTTPDLFFFF